MPSSLSPPSPGLTNWPWTMDSNRTSERRWWFPVRRLILAWVFIYGVTHLVKKTQYKNGNRFVDSQFSFGKLHWANTSWLHGGGLGIQVWITSKKDDHFNNWKYRFFILHSERKPQMVTKWGLFFQSAARHKGKPAPFINQVWLHSK